MTNVFPTVKTGTLKPPKKSMNYYTNRDIMNIHKKAENTCRGSMKDVVLYHDEREGISMRTIRDVTTMYRPKFILKTYRYAQLKSKKWRKNEH